MLRLTYDWRFKADGFLPFRIARDEYRLPIDSVSHALNNTRIYQVFNV